MDLHSINYLELSRNEDIKKIFFVTKRKKIDFLIAFLFAKEEFRNISYPWQRTADKNGVLSIALTNDNITYLMIKNYCYVKEIYTSFLKLRVSKLNLFRRLLLITIHLINPSLIRVYVKMRIPQRNFETIDLQL